MYNNLDFYYIWNTFVSPWTRDCRITKMYVYFNVDLQLLCRLKRTDKSVKAFVSEAFILTTLFHFNEHKHNKL